MEICSLFSSLTSYVNDKITVNIQRSVDRMPGLPLYKGRLHGLLELLMCCKCFLPFPDQQLSLAFYIWSSAVFSQILSFKIYCDSF